MRGPAGNVATGSTNVYRGSYTNVYGGAYPYYGAGAVAASVAADAAIGAAAATPYYYPQPYSIKPSVDRPTRRTQPTAPTRIKWYLPHPGFNLSHLRRGRMNSVMTELQSISAYGPARSTVEGNPLEPDDSHGGKIVIISKATPSSALADG